MDPKKSNSNTSANATAAAPPNVPIDVALVIQLLAGRAESVGNRRDLSRRAHMSLATIEIREEGRAQQRWIYTRDANQRGVGFITPEILPAGIDAILHMTIGGEALSPPCNLLRSRSDFGSIATVGKSDSSSSRLPK